MQSYCLRLARCKYCDVKLTRIFTDLAYLLKVYVPNFYVPFAYHERERKNRERSIVENEHKQSPEAFRHEH